MKEVYSILFGAGFTIVVSIALGSLLLRALRVRMYRVEAALFEFVAGAGLLSLLVTLLCLIQQARKGVFLWSGIAVIGAAAWRARVEKESRRTLPAIPLNWLIPFCLVFSAFFIYCFFNALAPEVSPDGSGYHLGNVLRAWRHHGFDWEYRSMYSYLSQGAEMLFLFAFAFGRHSSAALVHFGFACALPLLMICYGRRFGYAKAALFAALLVFASPVIAKDGVSAYNDLCVVTVIYAVFYLLQVWDQERRDNLLILIGLLAGFAFAIKYTAALTLPFAVAWLWWRQSFKTGTLVRLAIPAAILIAPWVLRNWIWVGNPFAPFLNTWFPNPYYHPGMERLYVENLKHYADLKHWWEIPLDLTLRGGIVSGTFSPAFLMLPLSLIALRNSHGRRLLFAALLFAVPAWLNTGARFLIPSAPFAALALGIALENVAFAVPVLAMFTALVCWPPSLAGYCDPFSWRISGFPIREALRLEPSAPYILKHIPDVSLNAALVQNVPPKERVYSFAGRPQAYFDRDIVVSYESALGNLVQEIFWSPHGPTPRVREHFKFLPVTTIAVRVVNNATGGNFWTVAEMRVFSQRNALPRSPAWRIRAWPNGWEVPLAFDNSYATRWSTWQGIGPHARIEIEFPSPQRIDEVTLECDPVWEAKLQAEIRMPDGRWVAVTDTVEYEKVEPPPGIRLAASRDVKALGFRYLLVNDGDFLYEDLKKYPKFWGMTQLTEVNGTHFYRID